MGQILFKKTFPHIVAILTFLVLNIVYFQPQLNGKQVRQGDIVSFQGMVQEANALRDATGEDILWTNSMFGGMPTYQIGGYSYTNFVNSSLRYLRLFFSGPIGVFNMAMVSMYIFFCVMGVSPWISIIGAISFAFVSNNFVLWEAGHTNKVKVIATSGFLLAGVFSVYRNKAYLLGGILFAFGVGLSLSLNHIQMSFYLFMGMLVYFIAKVIEVIRTKDFKTFTTSSGVLLAAGLIGLGPAAGTMLPTYEYGKDTMRGAPILASETTGESQSSSDTEGLSWNYAMQWSAGGLDLMNVLIPGSSGGGSAVKVGKNSATAKDFASKGAQVNGLKAPLYWGKVGSRSNPSTTSGNYYYGALMCLLFLMGLQLLKGSFKWGLAGGLFFMLLLALGENFSLLNRPLFDYFPMYSKFRAPSSILGISVILFNILAVLGLWEVIRRGATTEKMTKALYISTGILGVICLFFGLIGPSFFDFIGGNDARLAQYGYNPTALIEDRKSLMSGDAFRSLGIILVGAGVLWAYINGKLTKLWVMPIIGIIILADLWTVGQRYLDKSDFKGNVRTAAQITPRPVDQEIMNLEPKGRGFYRVFDVSVDPYNTSSTSYFHNTVGGYSPAKLQRAQDIIDRHLSSGNQAVFDMLNTKYLINREQKAQRIGSALGNAWTVESIKKVGTPNEEIAALTGFNPADEAVVLDAEFNNYIGDFDPQKNGFITLIEYRPDHLVYASNATSEQLGVFSEVWYGPDKGWNAYIDGNPVPHIRANYLLRAMKIPAGQHKVEFKFEPSIYYLGETISLITSLLIALGVIGYIGFQLSQMYKNGAFDPAVQQKTVAPKKKKVKPTTAKKTKRRKK